ncbi:FtsH protease activity modulator HflK [Buchnera aphidicola (Neophyllaphis varicolor)]|uniref:FtsH protease activity modulator HflK n=1 Tax=Buchnera aphidicola TaxID=9 RepID=UPI0031B80F8D
MIYVKSNINKHYFNNLEKKINIYKNSLNDNVCKKKYFTKNKLNFLKNIFGFFYKNNFNNDNLSRTRFKKTFYFILIVCIISWILSGFYTIKETDRGVVTSFGKFSNIVMPGLNWKPTFINNVKTVNVETVRELSASGIMLTSDENVVKVEMNVQYKITNPEFYLFNVNNPDESLRQATDSALRGVIGKSSMDRVLTEGRTIIRGDTQNEIEKTIKPYKMGITLLDVNFQTARPPEEVKDSFDDAIAARENREQYIREAEAYSNEVQPRANGQAQRIIEESKAYRSRIVLEAKGEISRFLKILPEYKSSKRVTKERLYIESMERILSRSNKIFINSNKNNLLLLPLSFFKNNLNYENNKNEFIKNIDKPESKTQNYNNNLEKYLDNK